MKMDEKERITKVQELIYELKVGDVMTRDVVVVNPLTKMSELREIMRSKRISGNPVVDDGTLVGLISIEDLINWLTEGGEDCPVREKMVKNIKTLFEEEALVQTISKFEKYGFGRFPIISRQNGKVVGILTKGNIIEGLLKRLEVDYHEEEIHRYRASHIFEDIIADLATIILEYNIKGKDFSKAGNASSNLKKSLQRLNIDAQVVRRIAIATYEAEMNIVVFADEGTIIARVEPEQIAIVVEDHGPGIADIERAITPGFSTAPDWVRELGFGAGMGLNNIKRCSDEMDITSQEGKGTRLEFIIRMAQVAILTEER
ncbi:MAG: CBS domain-containing protein [Candidatus Cloacimonadota bacterium]|nr:MAG: CBS domain-containing protein [Candidatus Cloacimonadota bacterium]